MKEKKSFDKKIMLVLLVVVLSANALAQTAPIETEKRASTTTAKYGFFVTDGKDGLIDDVGKDDLVVTVDGKPATAFFIQNSESPLLTVLAMDNSGSMRTSLEHLIDGAGKIVDACSGEDLTLLMRFVSSDKLIISDKFTANKAYLHRTLNGFYIEGGKTALVDAIYKGVELLNEQEGVLQFYRRTLIVISDGEERGSYYNSKQLLDLLREKNVQVVFAGLTADLDKKKREKATDLIELIAYASGGFAVYPGKASAFPATALNIIPALREQKHLEIEVPVDGTSPVIELSKELSKKKYKLYYRKLNN